MRKVKKGAISTISADKTNELKEILIKELFFLLNIFFESFTNGYNKK